MKLLLAIKKSGVKGHDRKFMENEKLLNMGPLGTNEYIIEQFHIRKGQDQNYINVLLLSPVSHTPKRTSQLKNPLKMKRIISLLDKTESL